MAYWLLLTDRTETGGAAIELVPGTLSHPAGTQSFSIGLEPDKDDDLFDSAKYAGYQAFWLLKREGYIGQSLSIRFRLNQNPAGIEGYSGGLLFALAVASRACPRPEGYPHFAATGVLDDEGRVCGVKGVPAKLHAAMSAMTQALAGQVGDRLLFYPLDNDNEVDRELRERAQSLGFTLCPVGWLDEAVARLGIVLNKVYLGNPYRGLEEFKYEHRAIYFGRQAEISELSQLLWDRERAGCPGILILAASGVGKSSLVQAGLIPALEQYKRIRRTRRLFWRVWKPSDIHGNDEAAIVSSVRDNWLQSNPLIDRDAHPSLAEADTLSDLVDAFAAVMPSNRRYLWMVNQMEELFTGIPTGAIQSFSEFLRRLQNLGVWVVATLRNDFFDRYQEQLALIETFGSHDGEYKKLGRLDSAALEDIIRKPAKMADLVFETDASGLSLAARIQQDMAEAIDALPLLEFALSRLYEMGKKDKKTHIRSLSTDRCAERRNRSQRRIDIPGA